MDIQKEREAFEKHASKFFTDSKEAFKTNGDQYLYDEVIWMWDCWIERAKTQAVPGWVSVETDLPHEDQDILFYLDIYDVILDGYYSSNTFIAAHSTHLRSDVSHWMYHPLPPTTQEPTND